MTSANARRVLGAALVALFSASPVAGKDVFRCVIEETRHVDDDGHLVTYPRNIYGGDSVMVDTLSGIVTAWGSRYQFRIVQSGSTVNGWILSREMVGPAATSILTIAIKVFQAGTPFIMTDLAAVHSGRCSVIQ